jgi:hypothetical protein
VDSARSKRVDLKKEERYVVSELRSHIEALESAREYMLIRMERGEAHRINHRVVSALDGAIQELIMEMDMSEEEGDR